MLDDDRGIRSVVGHVMAEIDLGRATVTAAVVCDDAITLREKK